MNKINIIIIIKSNIYYYKKFLRAVLIIKFIIFGTVALALGSINEGVYLIRRFGSDRSPHQWYLLKSIKYKKI